MSPTAGMAACRLVGDASLMFLFGACGLMALAQANTAATGYGTGSGFRRAQRWAAWLALLALLGLLLMQLVSVGESWSSAFDRTLLNIVVLQTSFGQAVALRLLVVAGLLVIVQAGAKTHVIALWAGVALAMTALTGHAAMHEGMPGVVQRLVQALHVLCAGAWVGGLIPLPGLLRATTRADLRAAASRTLQQFSRLGHVAVAGVLLTGVANTLLILGHWPVNWHSGYQALLALKIGLAIVMVLLAVMNRYLWVPRLAHTPDLAARALVRGTLAELAFAAAILIAVSVLGLLELV